MTTYHIDFKGARESRTATSKAEAIRIARAVLGADRLYAGAEYQTDRPGKDGDRECVMAQDYWLSRSNANRQMDAQADAVISGR